MSIQLERSKQRPLWGPPADNGITRRSKQLEILAFLRPWRIMDVGERCSLALFIDTHADEAIDARPKARSVVGGKKPHSPNATSPSL